MRTLFFAAAVLMAAIAAQVQAADSARAEHAMAQAQKRFAAADANGDGKLTKEEAKAKLPRVYKHFDEIDTAHTGSVTQADIAAWMKSKKAERDAKGRGE